MDNTSSTLDEQMDSDHDASATETDEKWENARFLLKITQEHSLSHEGVDRMCDSIQSVVDTVCERIREKLEQTIVTGGEISEDIKKQVLDTCQPGTYTLLYKGNRCTSTHHTWQK